MASLDELAAGAGALPAPDYINTLERLARARRQQYEGPSTAPASLSDLATPTPAPAPAPDYDPWAAVAGRTQRRYPSHVNEIIERTHRLTGMPRQEIMQRGFMGMGRPIPLYGLAGGAAMPSLYDLTQNNQ